MSLLWRRRNENIHIAKHYRWNCTESSGPFADTGLSASIPLIPSNSNLLYNQPGLFAISGAILFTSANGYAKTIVAQTIDASFGLSIMGCAKFNDFSNANLILRFTGDYLIEFYAGFIGPIVCKLAGVPTVVDQSLQSVAFSSGNTAFTYGVVISPYSKTLKLYINGSLNGTRSITFPANPFILSNTILGADLSEPAPGSTGLFGGIDVLEGVRTDSDMSILSTSLLAM